MGDTIFVQLMGGLGNQLFQIAGAMAQQKVTNSRLLFLKPINNHDIVDYRDIFKLEKYDNLYPACAKNLYQENGFASWNPNDYKSYLLHMYGYFQNYTVLKPILPEFKLFINKILNEYKDFMLFKIKLDAFDKKSIGFIHVRRGDYLEKKDIHHVQPIEYYKKGVEILKHIESWIILSDDIKWCQQQEFFQNLDAYFVKETRPIYALALMASSNAAIIANSTFSWMGAYLGIGETNVVYPKKWYNNTTPDLFPETWVGI